MKTVLNIVVHSTASRSLPRASLGTDGVHQIRNRSNGSKQRYRGYCQRVGILRFGR